MKIVTMVFFLSFTLSSFAEQASQTTLSELQKYIQIRDCSKKYIIGPNQTGNGPGKVSLDLKLDKSGVVLSVKENTKLSTIHEDILTSCLISSIKTLKFPEESKGNQKDLIVTLSFPISNEH